MAKPCIVKYKGKEYSVEEFSALLHDGMLKDLIDSGAIDQNKLKGDLKLLNKNENENEISFQLEKIFLKSPSKFSNLTEVANFLNDFIKANSLFDDKIENLSDDVVIKEFSDHILKELKAWDKVKGSTYIGFYDEDIPVKLNPELQKFAEKRYGRKLQDFEVDLYHIVSAFASPSADPKFDSSKGLEVFDKYMKTGILTGYTNEQATEWETNAKGERVDTGKPKFDESGNPVMKQVAKAYAVDSLEKVKSVVDKFNGNVEKAIKWLFSVHSYQELSDMMNLPVKGVKSLSENEYLSKSDGGFGIFAVTGVKLGSYILNRVGNYSTVTKDMWYARTMARLAGESLLENGKPIKSPWNLTKANLRKRVLADKAFAIVAKKLKTTPAIIQQRIWDFEKRLYEQLGAKEREGYASEGFIKKAKDILGEDINFRIEKTEPVKIANAPKGTFLNIGMIKGKKDDMISEKEILAALPKDVKVIQSEQVDGTEPTLSVQINRALTDDEILNLSEKTFQLTIPQMSEGVGVMFGSTEWGPFNPTYFIMPNNKSLSSEGGHVEEGPSFRVVSGKYVADMASELGSDQGGISDFLADTIAKENYVVEKVNIDDLRKSDPYLDEYLNSGEIREFEGEAFAMEPIVSSTGEVLDGYNRIAQTVKNGEKEIEVYKGQQSEDINFRKEDIKRVSDALEKVDESIINKIKNYLPYISPAPKQKTTAYKLFRVKKNSPGQIFPLFVNADQSVPIDIWIKAAPGETTDKGGKKKVKSTLGDLAYRPGWHSGDSPSSTHIGKKQNKSDIKPSIRPENQVWAEVEVSNDVDWQTEANKRAQKNKSGKIILNTAHITDQIPSGGYYKYKTNANMTGSWLISGEMKVVKILTDKEVADINKKLNSKDLKREIPFDFSSYGFDSNGNPINKKLTEARYIAEAYHKSKLDGTNPDLIKAVEDQIGKQEISFRKDDKIKGSYFEPAMTTDSNGDYVFFHFSTAPLKSLMRGIDSRKYYSTRTSREEKGLQYGVASYYTKPTDSERVVGGDKYYVTVSPDKVYPMDIDPNGYRAAAENKFKKNTPFREAKISKAIADAAARDGYQMAVGEWAYDRSGLTESETPEFRGDALVPLKPTEVTGKEKFKTGKDRGIKTQHPERARLAFAQQIEDLASDIATYKSNKGKYDDGYEIASTVMMYGGIMEDYGTKNERVRPLTKEEFDTMTKGLSPKLKQRAEALSDQFDENGMSFRIDDLWHGTPHKFDKFTTEKMGTGEGVQAFGWGLYFTSLKGVAENYARTLAKGKRNLPYIATLKESIIKVKKEINQIKNQKWEINKNYDFTSAQLIIDGKIISISEIPGPYLYDLDNYNNGNDLKEAVLKDFQKTEKLITDDISYQLSKKGPADSRNLYKVSLHKGKTADQYTYLVWDKPVSDKIKSAILNFIQNDKKYNHPTWIELKNKLKYKLENGLISDGKELYKTISNYSGLDQKQASLFLLDAGIDGVKFPAESISRGATSETARGFNYVVFDENAIDIEESISFRADMGQRNITSNIRLMAMLRSPDFKDLRNAINISPDSFYTPQKYAQLKPQIAAMSNAELIAAIDVDSSLENIFNNGDGPIIGLAFIEYINRLKNLIENTTDQNDIDLYEDMIQKAYESVAPFTTKVAQVLRQLGEIKSTMKVDEVQFYLDMIESLINANGHMINDEHRDALRGIIEVLLNSKKNHASIYEDLVNKGNTVTQQDIHDLNMAEVEMQNANAALHMAVAFLSPLSTQQFWSGIMKGNMMSLKSATVGLYSNLMNIGLFRFRNLVQSTLSLPIAALHKAGIYTFGLEKYHLFNKPISNIKYGLFLDVLQDAILGITKAVAEMGKIMIGKQSFRDFLDKSPIANRVFNIAMYGSSGLENRGSLMIEQSNHITTTIKNAFTAKGQKTTLNIRGMKLDVANSFKKVNFSKWFKANYPGSDYNALSAKDKKIIQNEFFNDPNAMVPTVGDKASGLGRAFMAFNSEFIFRLVALSDYLPKAYANNVEMTRLAQTLGLDEKQSILFMKDPAKYIEILSNLLSPEVLDFWLDTVAEVTVTKATGIGQSSAIAVDLLKNYWPAKMQTKFPEWKDKQLFKAAVGTWKFIVDSIVPFVMIPANFISLVSDYLIPSKPFAKSFYFSYLALKNKGTDQAEAYALSAVKNASTAVIALGLRSLAVGLMAVPGLVVLAPGKDDDDEKKKMKSKYPRMSINIDALKRYFTPGEDPSYKEGDRYYSSAAFGVLGTVLYSYASINDDANKKYYDQLSKAPRNISPDKTVTLSPFNMPTSGVLEMELKAFEASQFFIDQSWFVGINSALQGLTGGEKGMDQFLNNYVQTLLSVWWGFSSHAQQISDIYREATGKPVFDVTLPTNLQDINKEGYPGILGDRVWNNIFKKNEFIHQLVMKTPEDSEYIKFDMYGEKMSPVPGNPKNMSDIIISVAGPSRRATPNPTKEERFYMAVYDNKNRISIPGYSLSLSEPMMDKSEKINVFMPGEDQAESIPVMIMPKEYNKVNQMAGEALRMLHSTLLNDLGLLDFEVRGKKITPEDIMSKNWGNTKEIANVRNAMAVAISEGNKLLNTFLRPWELFGDEITKYIGADQAAVLQDVYSLIDSKISTYKVLNPDTGKMEMLESYLIGNPELSDKLYNLAKESIQVYLKAAKEAVDNNEKYNSLLDNPEMTIEQEKARKSGNF